MIYSEGSRHWNLKPRTLQKGKNNYCFSIPLKIKEKTIIELKEGGPQIPLYEAKDSMKGFCHNFPILIKISRFVVPLTLGAISFTASKNFI